MVMVPMVRFPPLLAALTVLVTSLIGLAIGIIPPLVVLAFVVLPIVPDFLVIRVAVEAAVVTIMVAIAVVVTPLVLLWHEVAGTPRRCLEQSGAAQGEDNCQNRLFCDHLPSLKKHHLRLAGCVATSRLLKNHS